MMDCLHNAMKTMKIMHTTNATLRIVLLRSMAGLMLLTAAQASAANFQIQPTSLDLAGNEKSGAFSVINNGNDKLNVQISVNEWLQNADGKDAYQETRDVVFFPKIMTVEPNEQRVIRIGMKVPPSLRERAYRLFVEELPSPAKAPEAATSGKIAAGLTIAFRYSIPIFVRPARPQAGAVLENVLLSGGTAGATVKNTGNLHIKLLTITFSGKAADGKELFSQNAGGWYVLQERSRHYEASIPKELCGRLATLEVKAQAENFTINGSLNVQKKMCPQ